MFCPNCGKEEYGRFCRYCGTQLIDDELGGDTDTGFRTDSKDGCEVDAAELLRSCSGNKIEAIKKYCHFTGASLKEGKSIIDNVYADIKNEFEKRPSLAVDENRNEFVPWNPPEEYYIVHSKLYQIDSKIADLAIRYGIVEDSSELKIHYGSYYDNIDCVMILVKSNEVVFAKINDKKPDTNIIKSFGRGPNEFGATYNEKKMRFESDALLGFKLSKAAGMNLKKQYATYFEVLQIVAPEKAKAYFYEKLRLTFKTKKEIAFKAEKKEKECEAFRQSCEVQAERARRAKAEKVERGREEKAENAARIKQMDREGIAYCPKCHSPSLSANKKGFGIGKAVVGGYLIGPLGLVAGNAGAKKIRVTCLKCGHQFWAGRR